MTPLQARRLVGHPDIVELRDSLEWLPERGWVETFIQVEDWRAVLEEIERLRGTLRAVRGSSDPAWQVRLINEALGETTP